MKINVTQEFINIGITGNAGLCPIAHAVKSKIPKDHDVTVTSEAIKVWNDSRLVATADTPEIAKVFIRKFDFNEGPSPIEFDLDIYI